MIRCGGNAFRVTSCRMANPLRVIDATRSVIDEVERLISTARPPLLHDEQLHRAAASIAANIREAYGRRKGAEEKAVGPQKVQPQVDPQIDPTEIEQEEIALPMESTEQDVAPCSATFRSVLQSMPRLEDPRDHDQAQHHEPDRRGEADTDTYV